MEKAENKKQKVQPYIIIEGDSLVKYRACYLVIDNIRYSYNDAQKAFDTLFKVYHVLNAAYPLPSEHLYLLIQKSVYDISLKNDKHFPYISDLL